MKKSLGIVFLILAVCSNLLSAQESKNEESSPLSVYVTTDVAYYPESKSKAGRSDTHFAGLTGISLEPGLAPVSD